MGISSNRLGRLDSPLMGFIDDAILIEGIIILPVIEGREPQQSIVNIDFLVVKVPSAYNAILG